jgi:hypothetical protein
MTANRRVGPPSDHRRPPWFSVGEEEDRRERRELLSLDWEKREKEKRKMRKKTGPPYIYCSEPVRFF